MATLESFRNAVSSKTGMSKAAGSNDLALIDSWANEGVRDILVQTHTFIDLGTVSTTAAAPDYDLPAVLAILKLEIVDTNANRRLLLRVGPEEIFSRRALVSTGDTSRPLYYAVQGSNQLLLYPTPDAVYTLNLYFVPLPTEMATASDNPSTQSLGGIPVQQHKAIEYYCLWQAGDHTDDRSSAQGERYKLLYDEQIRQIRAANFRMGGRTPPPFDLPYTRLTGVRGSTRLPRDPSTDLG
jgi:hypothetical protein